MTGNPSPEGYNHFFYLHPEMRALVSPEVVQDRLCLRFLPEEALRQGRGGWQQGQVSRLRKRAAGAQSGGGFFFRLRAVANLVLDLCQARAAASSAGAALAHRAADSSAARPAGCHRIVEPCYPRV